MAAQMIQDSLTSPMRTVDATVRMTNPVSTAQVAAIALMAAGWGWNAGNFVQPLNTSWGPIADALHVLPLALVLAFGLRYIGAGLHGAFSRGARIGVTALAVIGIVGCAVMIVLGATNPDPNSVGVHTAEDWMPVIVLNAGTLLWLATVVFGRRAVR